MDGGSELMAVTLWAARRHRYAFFPLLLKICVFTIFLQRTYVLHTM